jgi:hypothetical protein
MSLRRFSLLLILIAAVTLFASIEGWWRGRLVAVQVVSFRGKTAEDWARDMMHWQPTDLQLMEYGHITLWVRPSDNSEDWFRKLGWCSDEIEYDQIDLLHAHPDAINILRVLQHHPEEKVRKIATEALQHAGEGPVNPRATVEAAFGTETGDSR